MLVQGLLQKQSKSVNADNLVTIGVGGIAATNAANTGTLPDGAYEVWGNDNGAASFVSPYTPSSFTPTHSYNRLLRTWKVRRPALWVL